MRPTFFVLAAALLASPAAHAVEHDSPAVARIERAFADGEIDAPTRAIYGLLLLRAPDLLPVEFRRAPGEQIRCGTLLMKRAFEERDSYDADQEALFAQFGGRPVTTNAIYYAVENTVAVHYVAASGTSAAANVAGYADFSWNTEVDQFGWRAPILDGGLGGTPDLDIYLDPDMIGFGAYCAPDGGGSQVSTYIAIDPTVPNIETYVAHEFNHSIQFAYDATEADWLFEATATWMEDKVYDGVDDYLYFVGDFQANPQRTLSYATYSDTFMYGGAVFLHYLSERFDSDGTTLVRSLWTDNTSVDFFDALEDTILPSITGAPDGVMALYADFTGYRWLSGTNSDGVWADEAASWDRVTGVRFDSLALATADGTAMASPPMKLGARYVEVVTPDGVNGDRLTFTLHGASGTSWAVAIVKQPASGAATVTVVRDDNDDGEIVAVSDSNNQYERVVFGVANLGVFDQDPDTSGGGGHTADISTSAFTYDLFYSATGGDPVVEEPVACECNATRAVPSTSWMLSMMLALATMVAVRRRS